MESHAQCSCLESPKDRVSLAGHGPWGHRAKHVPEQLSMRTQSSYKAYNNIVFRFSSIGDLGIGKWKQ